MDAINVKARTDENKKKRKGVEKTDPCSPPGGEPDPPEGGMPKNEAVNERARVKKKFSLFSRVCRFLF